MQGNCIPSTCHKGFEHGDSTSQRTGLRILLPIYLVQEIQVSDTFWIIKQGNSDVMIPSQEYGKPLDNIEVTKYNSIRHLAEQEVAIYRPRGV